MTTQIVEKFEKPILAVALAVLALAGGDWAIDKKVRADALRKEAEGAQIATCVVEQLSDEALDILVVRREAMGALRWQQFQLEKQAEGYPQCPSGGGLYCYGVEPDAKDYKEIEDLSIPLRSLEAYPGLARASARCSFGTLPDDISGMGFWYQLPSVPRYVVARDRLSEESAKLTHKMDLEVDSRELAEESKARAEAEAYEQRYLRNRP